MFNICIYFLIIFYSLYNILKKYCNCKTMAEINEEQKKLLWIKVSVVDNNFDVTLYDDSVVPYF